MFQRYYHTLLEWNSRMNLTAVTEWEQVQRRHFLDSLSLSAVIEKCKLEECRFIDVGSGAGLPGIPIRIAFPGMTGTLLDATSKKVRFLEHVVDTLPLIRPGSATRTRGRACAPVGTARAVRPRRLPRRRAHVRTRRAHTALLPPRWIRGGPQNIERGRRDRRCNGYAIDTLGGEVRDSLQD